MRTTVDIKDDVLVVVRAIAMQQHSSIGTVMSELMQKALQPASMDTEYRNGVPLLPRRPNGPQATLELVNRLRDDEE